MSAPILFHQHLASKFVKRGLHLLVQIRVCLPKTGLASGQTWFLFPARKSFGIRHVCRQLPLSPSFPLHLLAPVVCHCLIGQPCPSHGATAGTAMFSTCSSSSSSSFPVPGHSYSLRSGSRHLTPELASQLLEETDILRPRKRPLPTGHSGGSPPSKTAAAGGSRKSGRHNCPFADCVEHESRGAGWTEPGSLHRHINNCHLAAGQAPEEKFLRTYNKDVCETCKLLKPREIGCASCLNRVVKSVRRRPRACNQAITPSPAFDDLPEQLEDVLQPPPTACGTPATFK